ncbi:hypothetical protein [Psychrobacillus vulpis]|uniref:Uncharacterized protein n=1 Tax=Psychrobacillus vulpis TaxID=2325572 RepID=A0A544TVI2_9BACI|nr:hypothetical protein [Psychrobacillus vulpis]TQR21445.1 hypothetical protein FG384_00315 [Psychrobacillus vulpis]
MFLSNSTLGEVVKSQVEFKLNTYMGAVASLILVQIIGLLFSMNGTGSSGTSINNISIHVSIVSLDIVYIFVALWAFVIGNMITIKTNWHSDFSFVGTRLSSSLANIIVLCMISVFAGVTTFLSNYVLRVILLLFGKVDYVKSSSIFDDPLNSILNIGVMIAFILMISAIGYFRGILVQNNKIFTFLLPVLLITILVTKSGQKLFQYVFIGNESILILIVKLVCISIVFFALSILCSNRLEVRS